MIMQSTLTGNKTRPNRRAGPARKKTAKKTVQAFRDTLNRGGSRNRGSSGGSVTGGHIPLYGTRKKARASDKINLPSVTPWKVILASFMIGICGLIYITHVFSTQQTLQQVQQIEDEYNKVNRIYEERRLEYDRMVGPKEIYQRAREQGFINAGPADPVIILKK
ncbi:MAG: hypothetical protein WEC12_07525 [Balneolaceae bacterium]